MPAYLYLRGMARATIKVIQALRETASQLERSSRYQWGHMGSCNCGFLAQVVTRQTAPAIHQAAMLGRGDWNEQLNDYCPSSGLGLDTLIDELLRFGFDREDLAHLERLSDPLILAGFPDRGKDVRHNSKKDVVEYFRRWALHLETEWASRQSTIAIMGVEEESEKGYSLLAGCPG